MVGNISSRITPSGLRSPEILGSLTTQCSDLEYMGCTALESSSLWDIVSEVQHFMAVTYKKHMSELMGLESTHNWITFKEAGNTQLGKLMLGGFVLVVDWLPPLFSRGDYHPLGCTGGPLSRLITALEGTVTHSSKDVLYRKRLFLGIRLKPQNVSPLLARYQLTPEDDF